MTAAARSTSISGTNIRTCTQCSNKTPPPTPHECLCSSGTWHLHLAVSLRLLPLLYGSSSFSLWPGEGAGVDERAWLLMPGAAAHAGALACAVARQLKAAKQQGPAAEAPQVVAVDLSPVAVKYTELNARRLGVAAMVDVRCGSWCEPCSDLRGAASGLVSNPPYIPAADMSQLQLEVQWCAPHLPPSHHRRPCCIIPQPCAAVP